MNVIAAIQQQQTNDKNRYFKKIMLAMECKRTKLIFLSMVAILTSIVYLSSCKGKTENATQAVDSILVDSIRSDNEMPDTESLAFWLQDSLANVDPLLTQALDSVYRHRYQRYKDPKNRQNLTEELKWYWHTCDYILALYSKTSLENDEKAQRKFLENLFDKARKTWRLGEGWTTMGMVVETDIETRFMRFRTYMYLNGLFQQLDDEAYGLKRGLNREYCAAESFCDYAIDFCMKMSHLKYWGGSMSSVVGELRAHSVRKALLELYKEELEHPFHCQNHAKGMTMRNCPTMLRHSCDSVILLAKNNDYIFMEGEDEITRYKNAIKEAEEARDNMLKAAFETFGFLSYREERVHKWIIEDDSKFVQTSNLRALNFLSEMNKIIKSAYWLN